VKNEFDKELEKESSLASPTLKNKIVEEKCSTTGF